jgi:hypothetical protein
MQEGWNEEVKELLREPFEKMSEMQYEIESCVKGAYTNANTPAELSFKLHQLAEQLMEASDALDEME